MAEQKTYINGVSIKEHTFQDGKAILKLNINVEKLIEQLQQIERTEKGYINLCISPRKETGRFGETHCLWLDTWKPKQRQEQAQKPPQDGGDWRPRSLATPKPEEAQEQDEMPF